MNIEIRNPMKNSTPAKTLLAVAIALAANLADAQSSQMSDPDVLGLKIGMKRPEVLALIKEKFQGSKMTSTMREVMLGGADLMYDAQVKVALAQSNKANVEEDTLTLVFLPNDELLGIRRQIRYVPHKQKGFDVSNALTAKYGNFVYFVYDDQTRFADQAMWSNTMLPGLSLVGTQYVQGGNISSSDFGTTQPYPYCWSEMMNYVGEQFDPRQMYYNLTDRSGVALNRAKQWKACGKALWVANDHENKLTYYITRTDLILMDLSRAPDDILNMPQMLKDNPKTTYAKPITQFPKASPGTPGF